MDGYYLLNTVARFLHVASAAIGLGTVVALLVADGSPVAAAYEAMRAGLKRWVHIALGVGVVAGLYTYLVVAIPAVREAGPHLSGYHPLMGVKIILALAFFALLAMQLVPVRALDRDRRRWLTIELLLGLAVFALGAFLRRLW